ncbi:iron-siderophore ABC transporter substrate-binding protein [Nocardioides caeni]|uniref:Iron-siderophore ABC transporter substrate-binding protein n=1 Tax=Nocardioides caeni TaxID=574700 RepID=A0A4S8NJF2_9ACTN|nr:iron-siderophore ABC transporter substrate-binding protein [Nocardioides caeni]THV16072.1 iron-siderophore ABC transporter substrate-binding protein [Nocardioides caeni]
MRTTRAFRRGTALVAGLAATLALAACGQDDGDEKKAGATTLEVTDQFPITIEHAFGETVIEEEPQRVATWGWGATEAAIASGVYPVAVAEQLWTVGKGNLLPWVEEAYDAEGVDHPTLLPDDGTGSTVPYDEFIAAKPDLILAPYSGITEEQFDQLNDIAPTVAYPEAPWTTTWQDTIKIAASALGRSSHGQTILDDIDAYLADEAEKHPEFAGKTIAALYPGPNTISPYTELDPRLAVMTKLGFEIAPSVAALDTSDGGFYYELSWEEADKIDADVVITYFDDQTLADAFSKDQKALAVPAVKGGHNAQVVGREKISAVSPPTALSFQWSGGMPELIELLAAAVPQ